MFLSATIHFGPSSRVKEATDLLTGLGYEYDSDYEVLYDQEGERYGIVCRKPKVVAVLVAFIL